MVGAIPGRLRQLRRGRGDRGHQRSDHPKIPSPLLRREAEIAADVVVRYLNKPSSPELAERAAKQIERLVATVERLGRAVHRRRRGHRRGVRGLPCPARCWDEAAAEAEPFVGTQPLLKVFVGALHLGALRHRAGRAAAAGRPGPGAAVQAGLMVGKYGWWPDWLSEIVTERRMAGPSTTSTIAALDQCAYAELSPAQSKMARRLLNGDRCVIDASAHRLEALGEPRGRRKLREGDLTAVALAARLIPL
jgi:hypothetical protein